MNSIQGWGGGEGGKRRRENFTAFRPVENLTPAEKFCPRKRKNQPEKKYEKVPEKKKNQPEKKYEKVPEKA